MTGTLGAGADMGVKDPLWLRRWSAGQRCGTSAPWQGGALMTTLEDKAPATARNSATVAGWTLISRVTGLLRVVVIGAVLGPTYFANCFQAGYVVPNIVFTVIAGPVLAMVLVPGVVGALR